MGSRVVEATVKVVVQVTVKVGKGSRAEAKVNKVRAVHLRLPKTPTAPTLSIFYLLVRFGLGRMLPRWGIATCVDWCSIPRSSRGVPS